MATTDEHPTIAPIVGPDDPRRFTDSGLEIKPLYATQDVPGDLPERLGEPGEYPYTRGVHRDMYRKQLWTHRQYAGYASAKESNERYRYLLATGSTGLSMAFDLPTQLGLDSDDPRCLGEVGRTGVAIDTIDDMRTAFDGIPLDQVSTSMTINAPAAVLLLLYQLEAGLSVDEFAPRLAFFFNGHNNVFQEVAKFRAARKMWAHIMRERFGAQDPKSLMLRFHTQTGGVTLTAQQPQNNIMRVALQS